jgi:hypothetical protein
MATPPRHITLTGLPAILLVHYIHTWWAWVVGCIFAFAGHTLVDWVCNEYWERKPWQSIVLGASCLVPMIVVYYFAVPVFGWPLLLVMTIMALGQDIIDGIIEVASKWQSLGKPALYSSNRARRVILDNCESRGFRHDCISISGLFSINWRFVQR